MCRGAVWKMHGVFGILQTAALRGENPRLHRTALQISMTASHTLDFHLLMDHISTMELLLFLDYRTEVKDEDFLWLFTLQALI